MEQRQHQAQASNSDTDGNVWLTAAKPEEPVEHELQPIGTRIITSGMTGKDAKSDARLDWALFALASSLTGAALSNVSLPSRLAHMVGRGLHTLLAQHIS